VADLYYGIDVTYEVQDGAMYSISCDVVGGHVELVHVVYGDDGATKHKERFAPYWVGGNTLDGRPRPVPYLATPGVKKFGVTGWLYDVECFNLSQKLLGVPPVLVELPAAEGQVQEEQKNDEL
jgi:hypothetical protein